MKTEKRRDYEKEYNKTYKKKIKPLKYNPNAKKIIGPLSGKQFLYLQNVLENHCEQTRIDVLYNMLILMKSRNE